ncbi:MAG TPA: TIGR02996 domain-containing protein, partial [Gemmataceae bacterium]|nr:TIGR02996 domain-containing protein [Gemmataceae bacterium]
MTEDAAFLQAILDHPDDDAPRLIYADWLEEHGRGARAEFIRVQCRLARGGASRAERKRLADREEKLLQAHCDVWLAELPRIEGVDKEEFRRGFVEAVRVAGVETFRTHARALFEAAPVQEVHFHGVLPGKIQELAHLPQLARLRSVIMDYQELR